MGTKFESIIFVKVKYFYLCREIYISIGFLFIATEINRLELIRVKCLLEVSEALESNQPPKNKV